jgi:UDP-N-acetylglucosamine 2-epimerase (non-hydrolysing)
MRALGRRAGVFRARLVHTGQHYDEALSATFFRELEIDEPEVNLAAGSGSHADQTARILQAFDRVLEASPPHLVVVVGDVNSTVACALAATKRWIPVAHVEAGLRSFDRRMPEELNRVVTDALSDYLFVTEESGMENLRREGLAGRAFLVGNVMIDTLLTNRERAARESRVLSRFGVEKGGYVLVTLHRPENVDDNAVLASLAGALREIAATLPLVFPVHPRTRARLESAGLLAALEGTPRLSLSGPLSYLDFLEALANASLVLTDSGGIQEESAVLRVPCLTVRGSTERPSTLEGTSHRLVSKDKASIVAAASDLLLAGNVPGTSAPALWDGRAAERIAAILAERRDEILRGGTFFSSRAAVATTPPKPKVE